MSPTVLRTSNLQIRVYPKDHNPPHVHVVGPGAEAKFRIDKVECLFSKGFSKKALKQMEEFIEDNLKGLMEAWHDYQA